MYTNLAGFGGDFKTVLDSEFGLATNITVASGYASLDVINAFNSEFIRVAEAGGSSRLLLGMAFCEGIKISVPKTAYKYSVFGSKVS